LKGKKAPQKGESPAGLREAEIRVLEDSLADPLTVCR